MTSLHRLTCRVAALENLTHDIRCVRLRTGSGGPLPFIAGQYASVTFRGQPPRDYSMANRPGEAELEFHIRFTSGGATRSEEHTSELQSLIRLSYAVFCL